MNTYIIFDWHMLTFQHWIDWAWWKFVPGVETKVKWPKGTITVDHNDPRWRDLGGAVWIQFESADPDDHYRPWLEANVGRQGWDWRWNLRDNDVADNTLTIRFRKKHANQATIASLKWA